MIPSGVRIFLCVEPVEMRLGFDRLAQIARERVGHDPVEGGALFVFGGRKVSRLKVLWFDRNGLCLLYKRFHQAKFDLPRAGTGQQVLSIDAAALAALLAGVPKPIGTYVSRGDCLTPRWHRGGGRYRPSFAASPPQGLCCSRHHPTCTRPAPGSGPVG